MKLAYVLSAVTLALFCGYRSALGLESSSANNRLAWTSLMAAWFFLQAFADIEGFIRRIAHRSKVETGAQRQNGEM